uniref:Uncharacterized protein n=1 Tax=Rhizophora mucronata TaxID=61149 RepID=A0A2P2M7A8_RHIMU
MDDIVLLDSISYKRLGIAVFPSSYCRTTVTYGAPGKSI